MSWRRRILVLGTYGGGNFGNDACFEATLEWLRAAFTNASIVAVCADPVLASGRFGIAAVSLRAFPSFLPRWLDTLLLRQPSLWLNWLVCLRALKRCDLLVVAGTGAIHDFRDRPWGWPSRFLRWMLAARLQGASIWFACVGAGPVINPLSRWMMVWATKLAARRCYRDQSSRTYMSAQGVDESQSLVTGDIAFLMPAPTPSDRGVGQAVVGVGVMNYRGWRTNEKVYRAYIESMAQLIEWLKFKGHKVRILIGQRPTDLIAVDDLEARLGYALMSDAEREVSSYQDILRAVANTDVVVASRYHVQIAALKMRRPVLSIGYGPMNDDLMRAAGLGEFLHDIERIDHRTLIFQCDRLINMRFHFGKVVQTEIKTLEAGLHERLRAFISPS
ncbi:MAG: polysaccharide pyruvyl transferase family protein [Hyphomonadaceae bacterium]|nr:polysaccharide pyruvyl transferase family protein [Hyphomonadaceae bacterium]